MLDFMPLPHTVDLVKQQADQLDDWGIPISDNNAPVKLRAKINYNTKRETINLASGEQITFKATMLLGGLPDVNYEDLLSWVDDFGKEHKKHPIEIDYKHDMSGSPVAVRVVV